MTIIGHNYIGHIYIGHTYVSHNYVGYNYIGHNYVGHNYTCVCAHMHARIAMHRYSMSKHMSKHMSKYRYSDVGCTQRLTPSLVTCSGYGAYVVMACIVIVYVVTAYEDMPT